MHLFWLKINNKNLNALISFSSNFVGVDTTTLTTFNGIANITLIGVSYASNDMYNVVRNGVVCESPTCVKYTSDPVKFGVTSFSNYTSNESSVAIPEFNKSSTLIILLLVCTGWQ